MKKSTLGSIIALAVILYGVNTMSNRVVIPEKIKEYSTVEEVVKDHLNYYDMKIEKEFDNYKVSESELIKLNNAIYQTISDRFILSKKAYSHYNYLENNYRQRINSYSLEDLTIEDTEILKGYYDLNYRGIPNYNKPKEIIFKKLILNNQQDVVVAIVNEGKGYVVDSFLHLEDIKRSLENESKQ